MGGSSREALVQSVNQLIAGWLSIVICLAAALVSAKPLDSGRRSSCVKRYVTTKRHVPCLPSRYQYSVTTDWSEVLEIDLILAA